MGDEKALIGKLTHKVMITRWNEGQTNRKYQLKCEEVMEQNKEMMMLRSEIESLEEKIRELNEVYAEQLKET